MLHFKIILSSLNVAINSVSSVPDTQVFKSGYEIIFRIYIWKSESVSSRRLKCHWGEK